MQYRKFGNTDLLISEIGFGAWAIGGPARVGNIPIGWGNADDATSEAAIRTALDQGINFFDTADFYGLGHSEELLGKVLRDNRNALIATKVGQRKLDDRIVIDYSYPYIIEACEKSLKRLQRDQIDFYQLHAARMPHLINGECIAAMEQLKDEGKIRYWGLSLNTFHPHEEADYLMERRLGDGFQLVFNLINQRSYEVIRKGGESGYGMIARMPLQFGLLTGKFSSSSHFSSDDHRSFRLTDQILQQSGSVLQEEVAPIASELGMNYTSLALSFILGHPQISTVIPGIRTAEHVHLNTVGLKKLNEKYLHQLHRLADTHWKSVLELMEKQG